MVTRSAHHVHTAYVDGIDTVFEMAEAAEKAGFLSLGFSEHSIQVVDPFYGLSPETALSYRQDVLEAREKYSGRLSIYLGMELDVFAAPLPFPIDYHLAAKHYLTHESEHIPVDGNFKDVERLARELGGWVPLCSRYFDEFADHIERCRPDIIAHFDLPAKWNEGGRHYDESDPKYLQAGFDALSRMAATGALLEVNTGAIARGYRSSPYPSLPFLKFWRSLGGRVILGSDCHDARCIVTGYELSETLMREAGYSCAVRLGVHDLFEEYLL